MPEIVQRQIEQQIGGLWKGAPDQQMASALAALSHRLLKTNCGAKEAVGDSELISWIRGGNLRSTGLKSQGLFEPVRDDNAFRRLKTVITFLRNRMGYRVIFLDRLSMKASAHFVAFAGGPQSKSRRSRTS